VVLPSWLHEPAPEEERPPRPLAPSAIGEDEAAYPPPSPDQRGAALRGKLLHRLFERLPDVPPGERGARAEAWLARSGDAPDPAFRRQLIADACRVIDDPAVAGLFRPDALAEAPIAAVLPGGQVVAGTVDRLLVEADRVLVADFKTGRAVPQSVSEVPPSHLRQMAAYRAALSVIFPDRPVEAALLYTAGPRLLALPAELLGRFAPDGGG
jgi:ATP-dependent helicase/nuclease subunit A